MSGLKITFFVFLQYTVVLLQELFNADCLQILANDKESSCSLLCFNEPHPAKIGLVPYAASKIWSGATLFYSHASF